MAFDLTELQLLYAQLLDSIPLVQGSIDDASLARHKTWLEELGRVSSAAISVFDLNRKTHVYFSRLYRERLGLPYHKQEGPEGFDLLIATESGIHFLNMLIDLKHEKRLDFNMGREYRL